VIRLESEHAQIASTEPPWSRGEAPVNRWPRVSAEAHTEPHHQTRNATRALPPVIRPLGASRPRTPEEEVHVSSSSYRGGSLGRRARLAGDREHRIAGIALVRVD
jgi:hypothetical protein